MKEFPKTNPNSRKIIQCIKCNDVKEHHAKSMCFNCYRRHAWNKPKVICANCGKKRPHKAKGMCGTCHMKVYHYDIIKKYNARKNFNLSLEEYRNLTKECIICGFDSIVDLHHLDMNSNNNHAKNLIALCPNHHKMLHDQRFSNEIKVKLGKKGIIL